MELIVWEEQLIYNLLFLIKPAQGKWNKNQNMPGFAQKDKPHFINVHQHIRQAHLTNNN